jgi:hypothetical protein
MLQYVQAHSRPAPPCCDHSTMKWSGYETLHGCPGYGQNAAASGRRRATGLPPPFRRCRGRLNGGRQYDSSTASSSLDAKRYAAPKARAWWRLRVRRQPKSGRDSADSVAVLLTPKRRWLRQNTRPPARATPACRRGAVGLASDMWQTISSTRLSRRLVAKVQVHPCAPSILRFNLPSRGHCDIPPLIGARPTLS